VRLWDLRRVEEDDGWEGEMVSLSDVAEEDEDGEESTSGSGIRSTHGAVPPKDGPCARLLEGHTQAVTALYFEDECLVRRTN
jgi:division protein 1